MLGLQATPDRPGRSEPPGPHPTLTRLPPSALLLPSVSSSFRRTPRTGFQVAPVSRVTMLSITDADAARRHAGSACYPRSQGGTVPPGSPTANQAPQSVSECERLWTRRPSLPTARHSPRGSRPRLRPEAVCCAASALRAQVGTRPCSSGGTEPPEDLPSPQDPRLSRGPHTLHLAYRPCDRLTRLCPHGPLNLAEPVSASYRPLKLPGLLRSAGYPCLCARQGAGSVEIGRAHV